MDKRYYSFIPLMGAFDPVARILAMDVYGLLASVSDFTIAEGVTFVCKELRQPSTSATYMKAIETLSLCAINRHYHAYYIDCASDICNQIQPSKHLTNPTLDSVFIMEKCLLMFPRLITTPVLSEILVTCGTIMSLLRIVQEGDTYLDQQLVLHLCQRRTQHLHLPGLALKIVLTLAMNELYRQDMIGCSAPSVLIQLLATASSESSLSIPRLLTSQFPRSQFPTNQSENVAIALEVLYLLSLRPFDSSELFVQYPSACPVIVASWCSEALSSSTSSSYGNPIFNASAACLTNTNSSRFAISILMRCGLPKPSGTPTHPDQFILGKSGANSLMYSPDCACMPALSKLPWQLLVSTSQVWIIFSMIRYTAAANGSLSHSKSSNHYPGIESYEDTGNQVVMDASSVLEARIIACAALHCIILASATGSNSTSSSSISHEGGSNDIRNLVVTLCTDHGLLDLLEVISPLCIEVAFLLSEIISWEEVKFSYCSSTFCATLLKLMESPSALIRRIALKILYDAVQHGGASKNLIKASVPRKAIFSLTRECISSSVQQLKARASEGNRIQSVGLSKVVLSDTPSSDMNAALCCLPVERITQLFIESLTVTTSFFDSSASEGDAKALSDVDINSLTVACGALIEILEVTNPDSNLMLLSTLEMSLWTALLNLSGVKECAQVLLGTRLIKFLFKCVTRSTASSSTTHTDNSLTSDHAFVSSASLQVIIKISGHFPEPLTYSLLEEGFFPLLFTFLKNSSDYGNDRVSVQSAKRNCNINSDQKVGNELMTIFCSSGVTSIPVCEHLLEMDGFLSWLIASVSNLCQVIGAGEVPQPSSPPGDSESKLSQLEEEDHKVNQRDKAEGHRVRAEKGKDACAPLGQRMALLANLCRALRGRALIFAFEDFLLLLSSFTFKHSCRNTDYALVPSYVTYASMSLLLALAPTFHSPAHYPHGAKGQSTATPASSRHRGSILSEQLVTVLTVASECHDLTVIDKVGGSVHICPSSHSLSIIRHLICTFSIVYRVPFRRLFPLLSCSFRIQKARADYRNRTQL